MGTAKDFLSDLFIAKINEIILLKVKITLVEDQLNLDVNECLSAFENEQEKDTVHVH